MSWDAESPGRKRPMRSFQFTEDDLDDDDAGPDGDLGLDEVDLLADDADAWGAGGLDAGFGSAPTPGARFAEASGPFGADSLPPSPVPSAVAATVGTRVVDIADEFNVTTAEVVEVCEYLGLEGRSGGDELTLDEEAAVRAVLGAEIPTVAPVHVEADGDAAEAGSLGGWVSTGDGDLMDAPTPEEVFGAPVIPGAGPGSTGKAARARTRGPRPHPLAFVALVMSFLPFIKVFVVLPAKSVPPFAGGPINLILLMFLLAPCWYFAERAEDAIKEFPDRWRGEAVCLWAKAIAGMSIIAGLIAAVVRIVRGVTGI